MTRDEIAALERALREAEPPDAGPARERARRTVLAAHAQSRPRGRVRRAAPLVWAALAATLAALVVTQRDSGPAQAVERLVRDIVRPPAKPAPTPVADLALPTGGRLLVSDADGLFVVTRSGKRTRLGRYDDAAWSPNGLYVAASAGRTLVALDPTKRSTPLDAAAGRTGEPAALVAGRPAHRLPRRRRAADRVGQRRARRARGPRHGARRPGLAPGQPARRSRGRPTTAPSPSRTPTPRRSCGRTTAARSTTSPGPATDAGC